MNMRLQRIAIITIAALVSMTMQAQLFRPMGLGEELCKRQYNSFMPQMHVEENTLYVCTNQGLYSKDLTRDESEWQLAGFEGIPLQDYARNGEDILALRHNVDSCFLLLSHDGGQTYEDITSSDLIVNNPLNHNVMIRLAQHPDDPNTLLVLSNIWGIYRSTDFGRTWSRLGGNTIGSFFGYHPARPEIIYNSGEDDIFEPVINISYDNGQTWDCMCPFWTGDNTAYQIAFNPSNPDRWIFGAYGNMCTTNDNGHTWSLCELNQDARRSIWLQTAYDSDNSNIVYTVSSGKIMCSTDDGDSWLAPQTVEAANIGVYDFKQYGDKLLLFTRTDVYVASKAELLTQSSVQDVKHDDAEGSSETYDLQGKRISHPSNGIFIKNGKKVVVK